MTSQPAAGSTAHRPGVLSAHDGVAVATYTWLPEGRPRAFVQIAHGAAAHAQRYDRFARHLTAHGFGVVAFQLLTGKLPYDVPASPNALLQRFRTPPTDPQTLQPKLSDELRDTLLKLVAVDRRDRWASMANLAEHLRSIPPKRPSA